MIGGAAGRVLSKGREAITVARQVGARTVLGELRQFAWSDDTVLRFRCQLPDVVDEALVVGRQVSYDEAVAALLTGIDECNASERRVRLRRCRIAEAHIGIVWLMEQDGKPAHIAWYFRPDQNDQIKDFFGGLFAPIGPGEMLGEGVYVFPEFRGNALSSGREVQHIVRSLSHDARSLTVYVPAKGYRSIRGVVKNGFVPVAKVTTSWRLGRRSISEAPWDDTTDDIAVYTRRTSGS